jgi:hypothetical protein
VEDAVEFVKQNGLTGAARAAADEVLVRVGEAKNAVIGAPGFLLHKVRAGEGRREALAGLVPLGRLMDCCGATSYLPRVVLPCDRRVCGCLT